MENSSASRQALSGETRGNHPTSLTKEERVLATAISSEERRRIIGALLNSELNVSQLSRVLPLERGSVKHHLKVLEKAKIVRGEYRELTSPHLRGRLGRYYKVDETRVDEAKRALEKQMRLGI